MRQEPPACACRPALRRPYRRARTDVMEFEEFIRYRPVEPAQAGFAARSPRLQPPGG